MSTNKRMICLANSRQPGGFCIAGKEFTNGRIGGWIRPISNRDNEAVRADESRYANSYKYRQPRVMDVMDVPLLYHRPKGYQPENWLLDPHRKWRVVDRVTWDDLAGIADPAARLWVTDSRYEKDYLPKPDGMYELDELMLPRFNGRFTIWDSGRFLEAPFEVCRGEISKGRVASVGIVEALDVFEQGGSGLVQSRLNDRISIDMANKIGNSLRLINVRKLTLNVLTEATQYGSRRRVKGTFVHCKLKYRLWVTDSRYEKDYLPKPDGMYELDECFLTVSLGKEYHGYAYKLIAAVIEQQKVS